MKFTDGYWKVREDVLLYQASAAGEIRCEEDQITVYAPGAQVGQGKKGLGGITLTVTFFAPMENVIGVRICHHDNRPPRMTDLIRAGRIKAEIIEEPERAVLKSGDLSVHIPKEGEWDIQFHNQNGYLTGSGWRSAGYAQVEGERNYTKEELALGVGEYVYGLGERFTSFVKNGQVVDIWNEDGGTGSQQAYKNIPFYMTNRGYGVLVHDTGLVSYEVASEKVERVQFSAEGEYLEYYVINGPDMKGVLQNLTAFTGRAPQLPAWSFGLWLTTSFTTDYDEDTVSGMIDGMLTRKIPLHVFHFDCFWMKGSHWCDFRWDERVFPDPEGMLQRYKERGLKICVWINPYIAQRSRLFREGRDKGYFILNGDGTPWQCDEWQPGMAIVDFTNPEACGWYQSELKKLLDMGVDTFKTDFGERIPHKDVTYYDGSDPVRMHNYYTHLYNKTVFELLEREKGEGNALVFARSATIGGQRYPVHWGGDCVASYESMAESLRGGLSLTASGFGFWSHDMGGFERTATPDLYKRWVAFGMLSTHSRLHGNGSFRVPWLFDEESVDVLRYFTRLKCSLMPYLYAQAIKTHKTGIPMMRAMVVEYPHDPVTPHIERQYMLGDSLMTAPVFSDKGVVEYYLPQGGSKHEKWMNLLDNRELESGWHKEAHGYQSLPLMVKANTILPIGKNQEECSYDYGRDLELHLFGITGRAETVIYTESGEEITVCVQKEGNCMQLDLSRPISGLSIIFRGADELREADGSWEKSPLGAVLSPPEGAASIQAVLINTGSRE